MAAIGLPAFGTGGEASYRRGCSPRDRRDSDKHPFVVIDDRRAPALPGRRGRGSDAYRGPLVQIFQARQESRGGFF
jgi:hypothetical protein